MGAGRYKIIQVTWESPSCDQIIEPGNTGKREGSGLSLNQVDLSPIGRKFLEVFCQHLEMWALGKSVKHSPYSDCLTKYLDRAKGERKNPRQGLTALTSRYAVQGNGEEAPHKGGC